MATLTTLASFDGSDGAHPIYGGLWLDANGDLFGTTLSGGATGDGTVFELVDTGSGYVLQTLASLDFTNGSAVFSGLIADASGDLFGTAQAGGSSGQGTVFELVNTGAGYSLQTLASFSGPNGAYPTGGLIADASGDLFGATQNGGASGQGSVFELVRTASGYSLQTLVSFDFTHGAAPAGPLIMDAQGDLFGTTLQGGPGSKGTVFELVHAGAGYTLQTLASFDGANGSFPYAGLVADAQGDLYGTTNSGGTYGFGTVFELVHSGAGYAFQTLASLDYATTGGLPTGGLVIDGQGNLYGTAQAGGAGGSGTVFELVNSGAGYSLEVLHAFSGPDGASPKGALILDGQGDLIGTTAGGGANNAGTVFEISLGIAPAADTTPPPAPVGLADAAIQGGYVNQAGDTAAQVLTGTAEGGALVTVYDNGSALGTATADATTGAWSFQLGVLGDGLHDLTAAATDAAGNTGPSSDALAFRVDATPPVPVVGEVTDAGKGLSTVSGACEAGSTVTLFDGGQQVGVTTAGADGTWSVTLKLTGGQVHQFTGTAVDLAGNAGASTGVALWANPPNKALAGGAGDDVLLGQKGDSLTGGGGHDRFVFDAGFGKETVTDFTCGADQIGFSHILFGSAAAVMAHAQGSGGDTVIAFDGGDSVTLHGVPSSALQASDIFIF
jgi:uncharacterized repeat protein (TIGR03803 family)